LSVWYGKALFGSGYLALAFAPGVRPKLPTTELLGYARSRLLPAPGHLEAFRVNSTGSGRVRLLSSDGSVIEAGEFSFAGGRVGSMGSGTVIISPGAPDHFLDVGHFLFALLAGLAARWFHATREPALREIP
jgi:hypothetical protein